MYKYISLRGCNAYSKHVISLSTVKLIVIICDSSIKKQFIEFSGFGFSFIYLSLPICCS